MRPTKLEVPLKLETLAPKMGPPPETEDTTNSSQEPQQPPYLAAVLAVHGVASESERAMHHDSSSRKLSRSCCSAFASSHSIGRKISNLAKTSKQFGKPMEIICRPAKFGATSGTLLQEKKREKSRQISRSS